MNISQCEKRLSRFYGDVAKLQNMDIIKLITGRKILDIGCGYGSLIDQIRREKRGVEVVGIDVDPESISMAKALYGIDVRPVSVHKMDFADNSFDTVILRETIHHFEGGEGLRSALSEIRRVCGKEVIIFDPNPNWVVKFSRKLIRHRDPEAPLDDVLKALELSGFKVKACRWRDVIAFPLSGGFVGMELVPNIDFLKKPVLAIDKFLNRVLSLFKIQKHVCWRYLIYATKADDAGTRGKY